MDNPLLAAGTLPSFRQIQAQHVEPAIDKILSENRAVLERILDSGSYSWDRLMQPLEEIDERLNRAWSPVSHMNAVVNSAELRQAYNACLPKLSAYATEIGQNARLYQAVESLTRQDEYSTYSMAQKKIIANMLRDFHLAGVDLAPPEKERYKELVQDIAQTSAKFEENLLDATDAWSKLVLDESELDGLPSSALAITRQGAADRDQEGWLLNLETPCYMAVINYASRASLRREMYEAYVTRASDQGPYAGTWDNGPLMENLLALRHEEARLLGFANYAERSLATKMARTPQEVIQFLNSLAERALPVARREFKELCDFAGNEYGVGDLDAWDVPYYSEKLRQRRYAVSQEELRPYFPEDRVLKGMFEIVERLYGMTIEQQGDVETWHDDVRFFSIRDSHGQVRGRFYLDLYARPRKRGGAWMDECITRYRRPAGLDVPVAYLTCNFMPPVGDRPALFTHDEVVTVFHEFGHGLHHMLTQVDFPSVAGIRGVAWDAVELPSQFMENWCWQREALSLISGHYESGEPLPDELFQRLQASKSFQAGMQTVRQLEFALFDFRLHMDFDPGKSGQVMALLDEIRQQIAVVSPPRFNRFPHSFSHIFAGGYAAGYYSYKWAEVLASDAFAEFEENGIFDRQTGQRFLSTILEQGGTREPLELFIEFRGREPSIDALLRHSGLLVT